MDIDVPLILRRFMRVGVSLTATCGILLSLSGIPGLMGAMAMNKKKNNLLKNKKFREGLMNKNKEESEKLENILISLLNKEKLGLPEECKFQNMKKEYIECSLSGKDLKKIKFGELGDKEGEVKVSSGDDVNVNLKILIKDFSRNYIFTNNSNEDIVISKGENKVSLKANGETSFILDEETLVIEKLGDYGIPKRCLKKNEILSLLIGNENIKQCVLTQEELSNIKFNGFSEGKSDVTKLWVGNENWGYDQVITLYFMGDKYIFDNYFPDPLEDKQKQSVHRPITITRGDVSVTLEGNMDSEFTVVDGGLKKQEVTEIGLPKRCEIGEKEQNKTCELSENDIKRLKLKKTGVSPDIKYLGYKSGGKINLKIEKTEEEGYTDGKKYILSPVDSGIFITSTVELSEEKEVSEELESKVEKFIIIDEKKEKVFKNEGNQLVEV